MLFSECCELILGLPGPCFGLLPLNGNLLQLLSKLGRPLSLQLNLRAIRRRHYRLQSSRLDGLHPLEIDD
jgi:hypothetical protein